MFRTLNIVCMFSAWTHFVLLKLPRMLIKCEWRLYNFWGVYFRRVFALIVSNKNGETFNRVVVCRHSKKKIVANHLNEKCAFTSFFSFYTNMDLIFNVEPICWFHLDAFCFPTISLNSERIHLLFARHFHPLNKCLNMVYSFLLESPVPSLKANETLPICGILYMDELDLIVVLFRKTLFSVLRIVAVWLIYLLDSSWMRIHQADTCENQHIITIIYWVDAKVFDFNFDFGESSDWGAD